MARLDARIKTEMPAWVSNHAGERAERVTVRELSLSGLLMNGWTLRTLIHCVSK